MKYLLLMILAMTQTAFADDVPQQDKITVKISGYIAPEYNEDECYIMAGEGGEVDSNCGNWKFHSAGIDPETGQVTHYYINEDADH